MKNIIATYCITNRFGLAVFDIEYGVDDRVLVGFIGLEKPGRKTWCKVRYKANGTPYFIKCGRRYSLDEFIRA